MKLSTTQLCSYRHSHPCRDIILKRPYVCVQLANQPSPMDPPVRNPLMEMKLDQACEIWHPDSAVWRSTTVNLETHPTPSTCPPVPLLNKDSITGKEANRSLTFVTCKRTDQNLCSPRKRRAEDVVLENLWHSVTTSLSSLQQIWTNLVLFATVKNCRLGMWVMKRTNLEGFLEVLFQIMTWRRGTVPILPQKFTWERNPAICAAKGG